MPVMIGGVIAAIIVAAGAGLVLAGGNDGPQPTTPSLPTPGPTQAVVVPTTGPDQTAGPVVSLQPPPTAGPVRPTPTPAPGNTGDTQTVSVDYIAITVPSDWEVFGVDQSYIGLWIPGAGEFVLDSWHANPPVTAAELLEGEVARIKSKYPDVTVCVSEGEVTLPNGPLGRKVGLCYTAQTSSGSTYQATDLLIFGVSDGGTIGYFMNMYAREEDYSALLDSVVTVIPSLEWKLYRAN